MAKCSWFFTLNNYTPEETQKVRDYLGECRWGVFGREVGDSGTPHLQGAFVLTHRRTMESVKRLLQVQRIHLEPMGGTAKEAAVYCKKEGDFEEFGEIPLQGKRSDLEGIHRAWGEGSSVRTVADMCVSPQQFRTMEYLMKYRPRRRVPESPEVIWIYGDAGAGKTHTANEIAMEKAAGNEDLIWWRHQNGAWAEGYHDQPIAILDDIDADTYDFKHLLRLTDKWHYTVAVKGSSATWMAKTVIITSLDAPETLLRKLPPRELDQMTRRISRVIDMSLVIR